jgi:protein phosphatase 1B
MGNFLEKPITDKHTHEGFVAGMAFAASSMQGWRMEMEDAHILGGEIPSIPGAVLFTVFDGHGGSLVANSSQELLLPAIFRTPNYKQGITPEILADALKEGFFELDRELRSHPKLSTGEDVSGSTATSALITPTHIIVGNVGDSRTMIVANGSVRFASEDHKPSSEKESKRIYEAGGHVQIGRVNGNLAVSRALGDFVYKDTPHLPEHAQKVSAEADLNIFERKGDEEYIILACDGIWDVQSCENVREFITDHLKAGVKPSEICERLIDHCLNRDSKDNMTVIIVLLDNAPKAVEGFEVPPISKYLPPANAEDGSGEPMRNVMDILELLRSRGHMGAEEEEEDDVEADEDEVHEHHAHSHDHDDHDHDHSHGGSSITEID